MSFGINGPMPSNNKPMIQESQNMQNDGGAGNLGYFRRGKQKKKKEENELDSFELSGSDSFEPSVEDIEPDIDLKSIGDKIKGLFKKKPNNQK